MNGSGNCYIYHHRKATMSLQTVLEPGEKPRWSPSPSRLAGGGGGAATGISPALSSLALSCFDTWMSGGSVTDASRGGDDKPQTTLVPFFAAPCCFSNLRAKAPLSYLPKAGVKSSCPCDCRMPGWETS